MQVNLTADEHDCVLAVECGECQAKPNQECIFKTVVAHTGAYHANRLAIYLFSSMQDKAIECYKSAVADLSGHAVSDYNGRYQEEEVEELKP